MAQTMRPPKWIIPLPSDATERLNQLSAACRGKRELGRILEYFLLAASIEAERLPLPPTDEEIAVQRMQKDILQTIGTSAKSLGGYLRQLAEWGFLLPDSRRQTYTVCFAAIHTAVVSPPEPEPPRPRGKYATLLHGASIEPASPAADRDPESEEEQIIVLQQRRTQLQQELQQVEEVLADLTSTVYALVDPRDNSVFYVGIALDARQRFKAHLACSDNNEEKNARIRDILDAGLLPQLIELERVLGRSHALNREQYWIWYFLKRGVRLTNAEGGAA